MRVDEAVPTHDDLVNLVDGDRHRHLVPGPGDAIKRFTPQHASCSR